MLVKENRFLRIIYLLFFLSGGTALIYEVIWTKELKLIMGNTVYSSTTVLAAFMGGLALGSIFLGRYIDNTSISSLKLYAFLELGIGLFALSLPYLLTSFNPLYSWIYQASSFNTHLITFLKFMISFCFLLIPTFLMGGTLPILSKYIVSSFHHLGRRTGTLYAINTFGAVMGTLLTGYLLIGLIGIKATTYLAVVINLFLFVFAFLSLFLFDEETAWDFVKDATILTDDHPYTEYPLLTWWKDKKKIDIATIMSRKSDVRKLIKKSP